MQCDGSKDKSESCARRTSATSPTTTRKDDLYHMSFVTQEMLSPDRVPDPRPGST